MQNSLEANVYSKGYGRMSVFFLAAHYRDSMDSLTEVFSAWQRLKQGKMNCEQALKLLCNDDQQLNLSLLDEEVCSRFFQLFSGQKLPPLIPLLLWQNCFYLGSPVDITPELVQILRDRTLTDIRIVLIAAKSYRSWHHRLG